MNDQRGYPTPKSSQNSGDRRDRVDDRDSGQRHGVYGRGGEDWRDMEVNDIISKSLPKRMIFYCNY